MLEIDCRICKNCDPEKGCKVYGSDDAVATRACAKDEFVNYQPPLKEKLKFIWESHKYNEDT